jgi:hypothetical protein
MLSYRYKLRVLEFTALLNARYAILHNFLSMSKMASTVERKNITFSKIGELSETNSEFVTTGETRRIIMRDGFHYFTATE